MAADLLSLVAVVTGASSGIGRAIARKLLDDGATVCAIGRDQQALAELAGDAGAPVEGRLLPYLADLADDEACRLVAGQIKSDHVAVDVLVHAAGAIELGGHATAPADGFDRQYQVNVRAPFVLTQAFLEPISARPGQVVFVNSSAGVRAAAGAGQYGATKHALKALADSLRDEVNAQGVRVLSVYVGRTATPMQARVHAHEGRDYEPERLIQPDDVASMVLACLRLPATAEVTDLSIRPLLPPR
jgi:NADP-dependent 3-hydroxy acid dehydrogenase YdfG